MANSQFDLINQQQLVRGASVPNYNDLLNAQPGMTPRGATLFTPDLPPKSELVRLGQTWNCKIATGSAFTFVAAWPTTRAELVLFNGEPAGGKCYAIDSAFVAAITSIAAASALTLIGQHVAAATAPTDDAAQLVTSRVGKTYAGNAKKAVAQTTAVANKWEVLATVPAGPAASIGLAVQAELYGAWILRPGDLFALNAVAGTAAGTGIAGVTWHELLLNVP